MFSAADDGVRFHPAFLTDAASARVQQQTRRWVLNLFQRRGLLASEAVETRPPCGSTAAAFLMGGLRPCKSAVLPIGPADWSLNAEVWLPSWDRAGLERLVRYFARTVFAGERLSRPLPNTYFDLNH